MNDILNKINDYLVGSSFPKVIDTPKTKCRIYGSTKPKK